ncbi:uncharacterized protein LOC135954975 [Calliphora vicina]|uniref:uncharacterized protein LOC135954975 n=1 Tax=Calliphora vicina TaxID=7373 RepID=UPI00325A75FC
MELKIIEFVRENPVLWDKQHSDYKNIKLKDKKWSQISAILGITDRAAKKRWKTIRDRYHRISKQEDNFFGNNQNNITKYKYADKLEFLRGNTSQIINSINIIHTNSNNNCNDLITEHDENCLKYIDAIDENNYNETTMESLENDYQDDPTTHIEPEEECNDSHQQNVVIESRQAINFNNSPAHLFMLSLALQIDKANLSTESLLDLQIKMFNLVKEEIKLQKLK